MYFYFFLNGGQKKKLEIKHKLLLPPPVGGLYSSSTLSPPIPLLMVQPLPSALPTSTPLEKYHTVVGANHVERFSLS